MADMNESQANLLCKSCGLCCTGHLFIWAKLRPSELDPAESLGLTVFRSNPTERGFSQPCPLWQGQCTVYDSPHYPHVCRSYKCKLLKDVIAENTSLPNALTVIEPANKEKAKYSAELKVKSTKSPKEPRVGSRSATSRSTSSIGRGAPRSCSPPSKR